MISKRLSASALVLVTTLALSACGNSDNSASSDSGVDSATSKATTTAASPAGDKQAVRKELAALQDLFYAGNAKAWCARVTQHAAKKTGSKSGTCIKALTEAVPDPVPARLAKQYRSGVLGVRIAGDRAIVTVSQSKQPPIKLAFVRQGDTWKFDTGLIF